MLCRVGMTTDLEQRKAYWESRVVGLTNWQRLATFSTYDGALDYETKYARLHGCKASEGGPRKPGPWHVYRFDYIRDMGY